MSSLAILIPIALLLGLCGLAAFFWALRSGQFEDLDGAALRIFTEDRLSGVAGPDDDVGQEQERFPVRDGLSSERRS